MRFKLSETQKQFIRDNYAVKSRNTMAKELKIGLTSIGTFMKKEGLKVSKEQSIKFRAEAMTGRTTFSKQETKFIKENYLTMPIKTIANHLGRSGCGVLGRMKQLGLVIPKDIIEQRKIDSRYSSGSVPMNKGKKQSEYMSAEAIERTKLTRFKKGNLPHNVNKEGDGAISLRKETTSDRSYKYIRLSLGEWVLYHKYLWETKNGSVPESHCLWFKDGDSLNCDLSNLELITRAENINRNWHSRYPQELKNSIKKANKLKKTIKQKQNEQIKS